VGTLNEVFPRKDAVQFRRQPELHSDGIKAGLFGEEGWDEPFVPTGGYTMASDVVSCV